MTQITGNEAAEHVLTPEWVFDILPKRLAESNKGDFGKLLALCGSRYYSGAAALAVKGALHSGVGLVCLATTSQVATSLTGALPECTFFPLEETAEGTVSARIAERLLDRTNTGSACLMGCGLGQSADVSILVRLLLAKADCQLILDADALNIISQEPQLLTEAKHVPIITPHVGEMSRLCDSSIAQIKELPREHARAF